MNISKSQLYKPGNLKRFLLFLLIAGSLHSCKDDEQTPPSEHNVLISYEKISSVTAQKIQTGFSLLTLAYPELSKLNIGKAYDVDIYKVKYKTPFKDNTITASGVVCVPRADGSFPILSFQNGTNTSNSSAPSMNVNDEQFLVLENLTGLGYVVTIPDYIGFGESNNLLHPYYHRESSDNSVINLIKAAQELLDEKAIASSSNGKLFMLGYSQGGWATLSAFKTLEENNTTGLNPVAASCGAGAYNLINVADSILTKNTYGSPVYLPYFIESHQRNGFLNTPLSLYFNKKYADTIPTLFNGNNYLGSINSALNDTLTRLMTADMLQNFSTGSQFEPLRAELQKNSIDAWQVKGKLLFMHGTNDPTVPVFESKNIVEKFKQLGLSESQVQLILIPGATHSSGVLPWIMKSLTWLDALK